jgi:hypothetical protein
VSEIDLEITEVEAALRHLKKIRGSQRKSAASKAALADPAVRAKMSAARKAAWADPAVRAKMSAARKAAWAEKYEADMRPRQSRETRSAEKLRDVPTDALEVALFGGRR